MKAKAENKSFQKHKQHKSISQAPRSRVFSVTGRRSIYIATSAIVLLVSISYANSLANGFVFDDRAIVLANPRLRNPANLPALLFASYRPLRDMSHVLDFALWGENPAGFHLANVLIHGINALLVFWLIRRFTDSSLIASAAAIIFAVHPLQTDAVTYISGRRDVLFAMFYLASFHCYLAYRENKGQRSGRSVAYFGLFLLLWALSLMSKEMAVSLPLLIFIWSFCEDWGKKPGSWWKRSLRATTSALNKEKWLYLALLVAAVAYGWYMIFVRGGSTLARGGAFVYWGGSFYANVLTVLCVHGWYLKQLVFPTPVVQYLGAFDVATTILDWRVIVSFIVVSMTLITGLLLLKRDKLITFAILSYFALLLPVSQIIPHHELLADHYLYLPMMSFGLLTGLALEKLAALGKTYQRVAFAVFGAAVIVLAAMTVLRNRDWKDDLSLWQANYREAPNSIRAVGNLASLYSTRNPGRSIELYRRCIELDPTYASCYLGLASLMQTKEEAEKLEPLIQEALSIPRSEISTAAQQYSWSSRSQLTTALALAKHNQGKVDEAEQLLWSVIGSDPGNADAYRILADLYRQTDPEREVEVLRKRAEAVPLNLQALGNLSRQLILNNKFDEAQPVLEKIIEIDPNNFNANCHLAQIYQRKDDCARARSYLSTARSAAIRPEQDKTVGDLAAALDRECGRQ